MSNMRSHALVYAATLASFLALDALYLGLYGFEMFRREIGALMLPQPRVGAAVAFYVVYALGLVVFAVRPALRAGTRRTAAANGAMLGLTAYATFDLTNLAVLTAWTVRLAVVDIAWGVLASALAAVAGHMAGRYVGGGPALNEHRKA